MIDIDSQCSTKPSSVIAAVKTNDALQRAIDSRCKMIFLLCGTICNISDLTEKAVEAGKDVYVHIDLTTGLAGKEVAVDYIKENTLAKGIISTRPNLIKRARTIGLDAVLRVFLLDSMALAHVNKQLLMSDACMLEVLPGIIPKIINKVSCSCSIPIIAGGLIADQEDIDNALAAGAKMVSTSWENAWQ